MPVRRNTPTSQAQRVALQRQNMQAAASGAPIQLRDATLGGYVPGGPAYGAVRDGRQVLVQRGAAGTGANLAGSVNFAGQTLDPLTVGKDVMWVPRGGKPTEIERRYGIGASQTTTPTPSPSPAPAAPPVLSDDADARASEARRMLQQATPYWDREENKAIRAAAEPGGGPRAGEAGYAQRADIQAWIEANKNAPKGVDGKNIVDRFLEQQKQRGLLEAPVPTPQVDQLATPPDAQMAAARGYGEAGVDASALSGMKLENTRPTVDERFQNPAFGTEVLRGMPATLATALTPDRDARQAIEADYSGGATPGAFVDNATLPNTAFVGNGMSAEPTLTPGREQDVPGITSPFVEPEEIRDLNLNGANALVRRHLNLIQGR